MGRKKLLILGSTAETIPLVKTANRMGLVTFVADNRKDSPAKAFAARPVLIDGFDVDSLCALVRDEGMDGVMVGCADILVPVYRELCERTGLFCYIPADQGHVFCNKMHFKEALRAHGLPVIPEYHLDGRFLEEDLARIEYPVLLKPVDNNSSRGMTVCYDRSDLGDAYRKAMECSRSRTILVEKYMVCDDFTLGYVFRKGKVTVMFTSDRYVNREQKGCGTITAAVFYPSRFSELYFATTHARICRLFEDSKISDGTMSIQGFIQNGEIMFYDPAFRISGGQEYLLNRHFCGVDLLEALIGFSLTGNMGKGWLHRDDFWKFDGKCACNLAFSVKTGTIGGIEGLDEVEAWPEMINVTREHGPGDVIQDAGTAQQNIARVHLVADGKASLAERVKKAQSIVKVFDCRGEDMMLGGVDADSWLEAWHG